MGQVTKHGSVTKVVSKRLQLLRGVPLGLGLRVAWSEMLAHARSQMGQAGSHPVLAVHEFRKAIRRCRALLRVLQPALSRRAYRRLRTDLRAAHRATSQRRDRDVVLDTLAGLSLGDDIEGATGSHIARAAGAVQDAAAPVLLRAMATLTSVDRQMHEGLAERVPWRLLTAGVQSTYRAAQRAMAVSERAGKRARKAREKKRMEAAERHATEGLRALHDWRKRTKELVYQVELLTEGGNSRRGRRLRDALANLSQQLGQIVDLQVLSEYTREHTPSAQRKPVLKAIEKRRERHEQTAFALGQQVYRRPAEKFARDLVERSKRDHRRRG